VHLAVPGSTDDKSGCADDKIRAPATSLGAPQITVEQFGKTSSSLGTLLVRLEIIATTYRSTIDKTQVFSLYSHLCIYVSMYLCIYIAPIPHGISGLAAGSD